MRGSRPGDGPLQGCPRDGAALSNWIGPRWFGWWLSWLASSCDNHSTPPFPRIYDKRAVALYARKSSGDTLFRAEMLEFGRRPQCKKAAAGGIQMLKQPVAIE